MRKLLLIAALLVPSAALATAAPVEEFETRAAIQSDDKLAAAPRLPFASHSADATVCGMLIDPLPDVVTLHLGDEANALMAFCFVK